MRKTDLNFEIEVELQTINNSIRRHHLIQLLEKVLNFRTDFAGITGALNQMADKHDLEEMYTNRAYSRKNSWEIDREKLELCHRVGNLFRANKYIFNHSNRKELEKSYDSLSGKGRSDGMEGFVYTFASYIEDELESFEAKR